MVTRQQAAKELLRRRKARGSLLEFIVYMNPDYILSDFSRQVCAALDEFIVEMMDGLRPILIIGAPPQHGKSEIVSRYLPAYFFGKYLDNRLAALSYAKDLASDMNRDVQRIMMSEEYKILFPESCLNSKRVVTVEVEAKRNSETFEIVGHRGSYVSQGVGGPLTGKRVDLGIIDDPIKNAQEALSETVKRGIWNWYISTFLTRLSKDSGQIIMATRWATDDLSGEVIKKFPRARVLSFKAIDDNGKALVPELHPVDKLLEMKSTMSEYFWSAMYQQEPIILGGNIFKSEHWRYYTALPPMKRKIIFADTAQKTKEQNDFSVFQCWGQSFDSGVYLIDQVRGKWEAPELQTTAKAFYNKHNAERGRPVSAFKVEDKSSGTGLIQSLRKEGLPIIGIPRDIDKVTRALDTVPLVESGNVYLPENAPWLSDYLTEFSAFPNGAYDDQIDPTMDAVKEFLGGYTRNYGDVL